MHGHFMCFVTIGFSLLCLQRVAQCAASEELPLPRPAPPTAAAAPRQLTCEKPPVYFCEEPADTVPPEGAGGHARSCDFRGGRYHEQVFRWVAGRGCLFYTPDFLFVGGANPLDLSAGCFYGDLFAPCLEIAKEDGSCGCFPFDPGLEAVARAVRAALVPAARGRWERCFRAAAHCCAHLMAPYDDDDPQQCPPTFDGWTCWDAAPAGSVAAEVCPEFAYSGQGPSCDHYSSKECYANGTWQAQTQYGSCSVAPRLLARYRYHAWALGAAVAASLPAALALAGCRRLRAPRLALHRNLLLAIIARNVLVIVTRTEIYMDELTSTGETAMARHGWACRALAVAERAAAGAVFSCMLVEALYLHRCIAGVFRRAPDLRWLYAAGAVIAWAPVAAWTGVMWALNDHSCWAVYSVAHVQWLLDAPRLLVLLANAALLADILRVLLTQLRNADNRHQLSTAKATVFLLPVFGSQFLLTALRPRAAACAAEQAYYLAAYTLEAAQGVLVATFYCYCNKEVHMLIRAAYKKTENAFVSRVLGDSTAPRKSAEPASGRRGTASTALPPAAADADAESAAQHDAKSAPLKAKLHVAEIISIQASERLAEILEPVYETVEQSARAWPEGGDGGDGGDGDYYGFTNASSVSLDCRDWIRGGSPAPAGGGGGSASSAYDACDRLRPAGTTTDGPEYEDCEMLDEILECMDGPANHPVALNPELLCSYLPRRKSSL